MKGHVHADQSSSSSGNKAKSSNYNLRNEDVEEINRRVFYRHLGQDLQDLHELFVTLNQQLVKDAEIHENVVRSYSQHASSSLSDLTRHLTKEDIWIHTITTDTRKVSLDFVRNLLDIQVNQKKTYEAQLKRLREVCNQATRNAMQMEREEWSHKLIVLRNSESEKLDVLNKKHSEELSRHKQEIKQLVNNIDTLKDELRDVTIKTQREQELQGDYIKKTMNDQKKEFAEEFRQMTRSALVDSNVLKSQFDLQLQVVENNYKSMMKEMKASEQAALEHAKLQNEKLFDENQNLKLVNLNLQHEFDILKSTCEKQLMEQKENSDKIVREQLAQSLQAQSALKAELAQAIQRYEQEDSSRRSETQNKIDHIRETTKRQHIMEIEQLKESHRAELRKLQIDLTTSYEENISRLKHIHEQELNRLLRESQRTQNLFVRYQNTGLRSDEGSDDGKRKFVARVPKMDDPMPNSFSLDEALSNVTMKPRQKDKAPNVAANSRRVSSYLRELDKYILGEQDTTHLIDEQDSTSTINGEESTSLTSRKPLVDISDSFSH